MALHCAVAWPLLQCCFPLCSLHLLPFVGTLAVVNELNYFSVNNKYAPKSKNKPKITVETLFTVFEKLTVAGAVETAKNQDLFNAATINK